MGKYYDEKVYLDKDANAIEILEKERKKYVEKREFALENFGDEIGLYKKFLEEVKPFLSSLKINNGIQKSLIISYLVRIGIFSTTEEFKYDYKLKNELEGFLGLNIIYGRGCCRNVSSFFEDVLTNMDIYSRKFYCNMHYSKFNFGRNTRATHVINLIKCSNRTYGFDPCNTKLYYFISKDQMKALSDYVNIYLRYKPYFGIITDRDDFDSIDKEYKLFQEESEKDHIFLEEYYDLESEVIELLKSEREFLLDFKEDTMDLKMNIQESVNAKIKKLG